jgi:hypothetical protein
MNYNYYAPDANNGICEANGCAARSSVIATSTCATNGGGDRPTAAADVRKAGRPV